MTSSTVLLANGARAVFCSAECRTWWTTARPTLEVRDTRSPSQPDCAHCAHCGWWVFSPVGVNCLRHGPRRQCPSHDPASMATVAVAWQLLADTPAADRLNLYDRLCQVAGELVSQGRSTTPADLLAALGGASSQ